MRSNIPTTAEIGRRHTLLSRLNRFGVDNGGATAVIGAILFPVVVGGLGLGAETGYWYLTQRKLQHIADVSAHAAGARLRADDTDVQVIAAAERVAEESGYRGTPGLDVDPNYGVDPDEVEVIATDTQPRLFSAVVANFFSNDPVTNVTISGRAVARVVDKFGTAACVLALHPIASRAVNLSTTDPIGLQGCDIASNSNAPDALYATSAVSTDCAYSVGGAQAPNMTTNVCDGVKVNAPLIRDPYRDVPEPTWTPTDCSGRNQGHPTQTSPNLTPRCFNGGLTVKGELFFEPGLYIIDGGEFNVNAGDNSKLSGTGVTFFLANGAKLNIGGSIQMNFSAPGPGKPYAGILFFGDREVAAASHTLAGGSGSEYNGAIYTPASEIKFAGNSKATGGCTQIIGARVTFTGTSTLQSNCENAGTTPIVTNEQVELVE